MRIQRVLVPSAARATNSNDVSVMIQDVGVDPNVDVWVIISAISGAGCSLTTTVSGMIVSGVSGGADLAPLIDTARTATGIFYIGRISLKYSALQCSWTIANPGSVTFEIIAGYEGEQ